MLFLGGAAAARGCSREEPVSGGAPATRGCSSEGGRRLFLGELPLRGAAGRNLFLGGCRCAGLLD